MFCYKCGYEIPNDALFCSKCGTAQKNTANIASTQNADYSNEALKIYFTDLLTLECIKNKLQNNLSSIEFEIQVKEYNNYYQHYCLYQGSLAARYLHLRYDGKEIQFAAMSDGKDETWTGKQYKYVGGYRVDDEDIKYFNGEHLNYVTWLSAEKYRELFEWVWEDSKTTLFGGLVFKTNQAEKEGVLKFYSDFQKNALVEYPKNAAEIYELKQKWTGIKKEFKRASELLQHAYDVNIVPKPFRNLYAVYYLSDFITTSNESLSTALLNYNLETIKEKLDRIIVQQREIIINQAVMIAQNEKIMKQNEQQLQYLASIEQNSDRAAQYAQIASNNAEACAWIGIANFISK